MISRSFVPGPPRRGPGIGISTCAAVALLAACAQGTDTSADTSSDAAAAADTADVAVIEEAFFTPRDTLENVDSPAVWHGADGQHWLLATAKEGDVLRVSDAATGELVRRVGGEGSGAGQLDRPNGVFVVDDLTFVVERNNRRLQVFGLPDFRPLGTFGAAELRRPYGLWIESDGGSAYRVWVTDDYEQAEDVVPPDSLLDRRVHEYRVSVTGDSLAAEHVRAFGETTGEGILHVVESIAADPEHGRLLIAEEEEGASDIKVYSLEGRFSGTVIPTRYFPHQAEGIVLYRCGGGEGYWIATDQGEGVNTFHVFDRRTLAHAGSFRGRTVMNTDGIALTQRSFGDFPSGAFYAVHDDGNVAAFSWADIAGAVGLRDDCGIDAASAAVESG